MRKYLFSWLLLCAGMLAAWQGAACAQEARIGSRDAAAIQAVIRAQLDAFAGDDANRAFAYATPGIRRVFGSAENFLIMVKHSYPVVYRPASVIFLRPEADAGEVLQPVRMTDADGLVWLALYSMQHQTDGAWLTNGCRLVRSRGQVT